MSLFFYDFLALLDEIDPGDALHDCEYLDCPIFCELLERYLAKRSNGVNVLNGFWKLDWDGTIFKVLNHILIVNYILMEEIRLSYV